VRVGRRSLVVLGLLAALSAQAGTRCIHVFVAMADNKAQGIVPVPPKLGNGDDPANNLYWGALYGVKTHFRKSAAWELLSTAADPAAGVLERCVFRHRAKGALLVADAYRGADIRRAVTDFLTAVGGGSQGKLALQGGEARTGGAADLAAYVGHNGLMDFALAEDAVQSKGAGRDAIILACKSKPYFAPWLERLKSRGVLLTTGLMAPEAYTLHAALEGWLADASPEQVREKAAAAYHAYQKCGLAAARRLFHAER